MVVVSVDLLERFAHQRPHPDANVGRQAVHEAETGNHNLNLWMLSCIGWMEPSSHIISMCIVQSLMNVEAMAALLLRSRTRADTKMKYIWRKAKMACRTGLSPRSREKQGELDGTSMKAPNSRPS